MTREEFIQSHRHEFGGLVLSAATAGLTGAALSVFLRGVYQRIDAELSQAWQELQPKPANGVAGPRASQAIPSQVKQ